MKKILYAALFCCTSLLTPSCVDDLNQYPHLETTSENVYTSAENYYKVLAKIYTSMVTTGQEKEEAMPTSPATTVKTIYGVTSTCRKSEQMK